MMTNNRSAGEISPATEKDLTALIALDTVAAQEPQRCEAIRRRIEQKTCFVLRLEGKIAGYGVLHYHFFGCGFIELLMVDPALRGQVDNLDDGDPELFYFCRLSRKND
ncbi:TPA: GNAT family N-acetyltransferase [Morganella morganii]